MLQNAGYEYKSYADPVQALQEFKPCFCDLILLDIKMPVLKRIWALQKYKRNDNTIQIIFITAGIEDYCNELSKVLPRIGWYNFYSKTAENEDPVKQ